MLRKILPITLILMFLVSVVPLIAVAVPAGASPVNSVTFVEVGDGGAGWTIDDAYSGTYSVSLKSGTLGLGSAGRAVVPLNITLANITAISFKFKVNSTAEIPNLFNTWPLYMEEGQTYNETENDGYLSPYIILALDQDGDGTADAWLISQPFGRDPDSGWTPTWEEWDAASNASEYPPGSGMNPVEALWHNHLWTDNITSGGGGAWPAGWEPLSFFNITYPGANVVEVKVALGEWDITVEQTAYVDDLEINGVTLLSEPVEVEEATLRLEPQTLNLKSHGRWVTAYIKPPTGYGPEDIVVDSVQLEGVPADWGNIQGSILMVKFNRTAVESMLSPGDEVVVTVEGQLKDGAEFEATDTIRVIAPEANVNILLRMLEAGKEKVEEAFATLEARGITIPEEAEDAFNEGMLLADKAHELLEDGDFDGASMTAIHAMQKFKQALMAAYQSSEEEGGTEEERRAQETVTLREAIKRERFLVSRLETLTDKVKDTIAEALTHLDSAEDFLDAGEVENAAEELATARNILRQSLVNVDKIAKAIKEKKFEMILRRAEERLRRYEERMDRLLGGLPAAQVEHVRKSLEIARSRLQAAKGFVQLGNVGASMEELGNVSEELDRGSWLTTIGTLENNIQTLEGRLEKLGEKVDVTTIESTLEEAKDLLKKAVSQLQSGDLKGVEITVIHIKSILGKVDHLIDKAEASHERGAEGGEGEGKGKGQEPSEGGKRKGETGKGQGGTGEKKGHDKRE